MPAKQNYKYIPMIIIPIIIAIFNLIMIMFPKEIIISAKSGLLLWYSSVLPSLFPFMICTNLLTNLGFPSFVGTLLEPITSKVFKVRGCGVFPIIMGVISGYPMGAKLTLDLYNSGQLSKNEAQRLICFTNNSGPLFILGAVAVSMFSSSSIGYFMMFIHYISALIIGIALGMFSKKPTASKCGIKSALRAIKLCRIKNKKNFGEILGESTTNAISAILQVGGYVILFSVIVEILNQTGILSILTATLQTFNIDSNIAKAICVGTFEITNGCNILKGNINIHSILLAAAMISWAGFSIHAQSISFISKSDLKISPYLFCKLLQAILTYILGITLYPLFKINESIATVSTGTQAVNLSGIITFNTYNAIVITLLLVLALFTMTFSD